MAAAKATLTQVLRLGGLDPALVIVTVDGKFVPRSEYKSLTLPAGTRVRAWELQDGG